MAAADDLRREVEAFEYEAEVLVGYQLDLLSQLELQLRTVQHTMRHIEKLRVVGRRVGPELSDGERESTLGQLRSQLDALESYFSTERDSCSEMQRTLERMHQRLQQWRNGPASPATSQDD